MQGDGEIAKRIASGLCPKCRSQNSFAVHQYDDGRHYQKCANCALIIIDGGDRCVPDMKPRKT